MIFIDVKITFVIIRNNPTILYSNFNLLSNKAFPFVPVAAGNKSYYKSGIPLHSNRWIKHLLFHQIRQITTTDGFYFINLKSATIIQYTIKGRFMSR